MKAYKEHKFIVFEFEDGKTVKYDLSNGETIGKLGKPVKSLNSQLQGYNVYDVIDSFEDENYKSFLGFVLKHFVNDCRNEKDRRDEVDRVRNVGTFLSRLCFYSHFEQYFAAGIHNIDKDLNHGLSEIPKLLIKLSTKYNFTLKEQLLKDYNRNPDLFVNVMSVECDSISHFDRYYNLLKITDQRYSSRIPIYYNLIRDHNYNPVSLIKYMDYLITYEALTLNDVLVELQDYCNMMSTISPKYDKYPRSFLTTHRIASRNYERLKTEYPEEAFTHRIDSSLEWSKDDYKVIYPKAIQDIKDEAVTQNNCVSSYIEKVIGGKCHIVFLRDKKALEESLVTIEIRDSKVVQAKGKFNREVTAEEQKIIEKYNQYLSKRNSAYPICNVGEVSVC